MLDIPNDILLSTPSMVNEPKYLSNFGVGSSHFTKALSPTNFSSLFKCDVS